MKEDEAVEKQFCKLENRLEADYANLREEVKGLKEQVRQDEWTIHGLLTRMEITEARMALLSSQVGRGDGWGDRGFGEELGVPGRCDHVWGLYPYRSE